MNKPGAGSIRRASACAITLALVCGSFVPAGATEPSIAAGGADCVERAEAYAAEAFRAYADQNYDRAVALYLKAYEAAPSADILFNLARVHDLGLHDLELAISFYQDYVVASDATPDRVELARERISRLEALQHAARERRAASPAEPTDALPAGALPVDATAAPAASDWTPWRVGGLAAGGLGLVGIGLGVGYGVAALSDAAAARKDCDGDVCASRLGIDASRSAAQNADIATAGFAIGGGLLAAGLALLWVDRDNSSGRDALASAKLAPIATASQLGVSVSGRW